MSNPSSGAEYPTAGWPANTVALNFVDPRRKLALKDVLIQQFPMVESLLIIRHGAIVHEQYLNEQGPTDLAELLSITKSVTGTLVGVMLQQGLFDSLDQRLADILPDYFTGAADPRAKDITLRHLLTMTSGFEWDFHQRDRQIWRLRHIEDVLNGPMFHAPGEVFSYDDCNVQLISHAINRVTGQSASGCASQGVFEPLGITNHPWTVDEWEFANCSGGLALAPRDLAKIAYLHLKQGAWDGEQLLAPEYVQAATSAQTAGGYPANTGYGWLWWVCNERGYDAYYALGLGGRMLFVAPDLDLIIVLITDDSLAMDDINVTRRLITEVVIPSLPPG